MSINGEATVDVNSCRVQNEADLGGGVEFGLETSVQ